MAIKVNVDLLEQVDAVFADFLHKTDPAVLAVKEADKVLAQFLELENQRELARIQADFAKELGRIFRSWGKAFFDEMEKKGLFEKLYKDAQKKLKKVKEAKSDKAQVGIIGKLTTPLIDIRQVVQKYATKGYDASGQAALEQLRVNERFKLKDPQILEKIKQHAYQHSKVATDDIKKWIETTIINGYYRDGKNPKAMQKRVRELFDNNISKGRAYLIAHQETLIPTMQARHDTFSRNGIEKKEWRTSGPKHFAGQVRYKRTPKGKSRTWRSSAPRPTHAAASGQIVPIDEPFIVGGARLMYPGDPSGPPREVMRCRCVMLPVIPDSFEPSDAWTGEKIDEGKLSFMELVAGLSAVASRLARVARTSALAEGKTEKEALVLAKLAVKKKFETK